MENLTELVSVSFAGLRPVPMWITGRIHANQWPDVMRIAGRMPENTQGNCQLESIDCIEVKNLKFSYGQCNVVDKQNLKFEKGKIYGIIGENGSGKSTFINLLLGLYIDETEGNIYYNQICIKDLDMKQIRKKLIGVSEQESTMINDSLSYNLFFNNRYMQIK